MQTLRYKQNDVEKNLQLSRLENTLGMRNKTVEAPFAAEGLKMFRKSKNDKLGVVSFRAGILGEFQRGSKKGQREEIISFATFIQITTSVKLFEAINGYN